VSAQGIEIAIYAVRAIVSVGILVLVFRPAFLGREAAQAAIGSHRLAIGGVISVLVMNVLLTVPLVRSGLLQLDGGFTTGSFILAAFSTDLPMLIFVYVRLVMPGAVSWRELGLVPVKFDYLLRWGLGGGLVGLVVVDAIGTLLAQFGLRSNQIEEFEFALKEGPVAFALLLVTAGLVAPFVEELFFRGFLFGLYRRRQPVWLAYLVSSVVFTLLHLQPNRMNVQQMAGLAIGIFLLATLLAWLYQHTGSLYPGILAHAVNNATGLILFYALGLQ